MKALQIFLFWIFPVSLLTLSVLFCSSSGNHVNTELNQNVPNPFKYETTFTYKIAKAGFVELEVSDQLGRVIEKLVNTNQESGIYSVLWDSKDYSPGIYYYSLKVNNVVLIKKAVKLN